MSAIENKESIRKYFAALSGLPKPPEVVNEFVEEQPLRDHIAQAEEGLPEYELVAEDMIAEGDQVAVKARLIGTHLGTYNGIPATGKPVDIPFHITYKIENGKIVDHWMVFDTLVFLQQLGIVPVQA
jgi:predicted ester cyclase